MPTGPKREWKNLPPKLSRGLITIIRQRSEVRALLGPGFLLPSLELLVSGDFKFRSKATKFVGKGATFEYVVYWEAVCVCPQHYTAVLLAEKKAEATRVMNVLEELAAYLRQELGELLGQYVENACHQAYDESPVGQVEKLLRGKDQGIVWLADEIIEQMKAADLPKHTKNSSHKSVPKMNASKGAGVLSVEEIVTAWRKRIPPRIRREQRFSLCLSPVRLVGAGTKFKTARSQFTRLTLRGFQTREKPAWCSVSKPGDEGERLSRGIFSGAAAAHVELDGGRTGRSVEFVNKGMLANTV